MITSRAAEGVSCQFGEAPAITNGGAQNSAPQFRREATSGTHHVHVCPTRTKRTESRILVSDWTHRGQGRIREGTRALTSHGHFADEARSDCATRAEPV